MAARLQMAPQAAPVPLCVKERRSDFDDGQGRICCCGDHGDDGAAGAPPVVLEKAHIIRLAVQYTPCAGCSAAVKGLLERPMSQLRLLNAVVEEAGDCGGGDGSDGLPPCSRFAGSDATTMTALNGSNSNYSAPLSSLNTAAGRGSETVTAARNGCQCRMLQLRGSYLLNRGRLEQLLESFPLSTMVKKVQPRGSSLRCETHRRNAGGSGSGGSGGGGGGDGWEWEDAWERLPAEMREKVATIEVSALEAAMHHATSTHRFCADCKHNVVTAFDVLTNRYDPADLECDEEYNSELFWPFVNRVTGGEGDGGGVRILSCPLEEVEELICWHEDFDSREYTRSSQRHAATLEHGQREIRSIVGSVLLSQLRTAWHNHLAQVQGEQYLFCLVLHALRTHLAAIDGYELGAGSGGSAITAGQNGFFAPQPCPRCGEDVRPGCPHCGGTGLSAAELDLLEDGDDDKKKSKSRKKKDRQKRAKAQRKASEDEGDHTANPHSKGPAAAAAAAAPGRKRAGSGGASSGGSHGNAAVSGRSGSGGGSGAHRNGDGHSPGVSPTHAGGEREAARNGHGTVAAAAGGTSAAAAAAPKRAAAPAPTCSDTELQQAAPLPPPPPPSRRKSATAAAAAGSSSKQPAAAVTAPAHAQPRAPTGLPAAAAPASNGSGSGSSSGGHGGAYVSAGGTLRQPAAATACDPLLNGGGSLLSMLDMLGGGDGAEDGDDDSDVDEDLLREMERLKCQKNSSDAQRSREMLRSNLQRNFQQLLSTGSSGGGGGGFGGGGQG